MEEGKGGRGEIAKEGEGRGERGREGREVRGREEIGSGRMVVKDGNEGR